MLSMEKGMRKQISMICMCLKAVSQSCLRGGAGGLRRRRRRPDWQLPSSQEDRDLNYAVEFSSHRSCDSEWVPDSLVSSTSAGELTRFCFTSCFISKARCFKQKIQPMIREADMKAIMNMCPQTTNVYGQRLTSEVTIN